MGTEDLHHGARIFRELRRESVRAALRDPLLLARPRFAKRLAGSALPLKLLEARR